MDVRAVCLVAQSWLTLCHPMNCSWPGPSVHGDSSDKKTGVDCHALLQEIFPTQGSNPGLLYYRWFFTIWATREVHGCMLCYAKSLQSCLTLCDSIDGSPSGFPVPGILQARTLEWVAISFCNAWKWKVKVKSLNRVRPSATPWTAAHQAPPSMGFSRQEYWSGVPLPSLPWIYRHCIFYIMKHSTAFL